MSIKTIAKYLLLGIAVIVTAFLGTIAGNKFLEAKQESHYQNKIDGLSKGESSLIKSGMKMPSVEIIGLDYSTSNSKTLAMDEHALFLFLAIGCDPCTEAIESWIEYKDDIPPNIKIYGICEDEIEYTRVYVEKTKFPFPVYCDTNFIFSSEYDMNVYPSVIGINPDGVISFVQHGVGESFSPLEAIERLMK